jgi:hypothetical protein
MSNLSRAWYIPHPSHSLWYDHHYHIRQRIQIMKWRFTDQHTCFIIGWSPAFLGTSKGRLVVYLKIYHNRFLSLSTWLISIAVSFDAIIQMQLKESLIENQSNSTDSTGKPMIFYFLAEVKFKSRRIRNKYSICHIRKGTQVTAAYQHRLQANNPCVVQVHVKFAPIQYGYSRPTP